MHMYTSLTCSTAKVSLSLFWEARQAWWERRGSRLECIWFHLKKIHQTQLPIPPFPLIVSPSSVNTWSVTNECTYSSTSARQYSRKASDNTVVAVTGGGNVSPFSQSLSLCLTLPLLSWFLLHHPLLRSALSLPLCPLNWRADSSVWWGLGLTARLDEIAHLFFGGESAPAEAEWHQHSCMWANFAATQNRFGIAQEYEQGRGYFCAWLMFLEFFRLSFCTYTPSLHT